mgnify:CR=1 FL=1
MSEKLGKIERSDLERIFTHKTGAISSKIIQGPQFGVDIAIVKIGDNKGLITASDPTSLIPSLGLKESAWLSVILTANDIATSGFLPQYSQFMLHLPSNISTAELEEYWGHIHDFCIEIGVAITGGHTGFGDIGQSTISGGVTMFTIAELSKIKSTAVAKPDLDIIVTKSAALSSGAILAKSFPNYTLKHLGKDVQRELSDTFYQLSILPEVEAIRTNSSVFNGIVALHDITEGGVLGAVYELCEAGGIGVVVNQDQIPLGKHQEAICELFSIDPYRCTSAGSLLIACKKEVTKEVIKTLKTEGIDACKVGETVANREEKIIINQGEKKEFLYVDKDPYWEAFFKAIADNLN